LPSPIARIVPYASEAAGLAIRRPPPTALGTLDAIHLASAALWRENQGTEIAMATHDEALATAARASGFSVIGGP
jgi:hypothetical protein